MALLAPEKGPQAAAGVTDSERHERQTTSCSKKTRVTKQDHCMCSANHAFEQQVQQVGSSDAPLRPLRGSKRSRQGPAPFRKVQRNACSAFESGTALAQRCRKGPPKTNMEVGTHEKHYFSTMWAVCFESIGRVAPKFQVYSTTRMLKCNYTKSHRTTPKS